MQHYWNKPETADCTIIIPLPSTARRITLRLHREYLSAKSLFLRGLFSGSSPLDLIQILSASRLHPRLPRSRLPRLLPSPPSHPVLFLPVPDPFTIEPLFHWMYFGNTDHIENALDKGDIQWQGLARNVEYLGLCTDIKVFLGGWYRHWLLPARCPPADCMPCATDEDEESDLDSECDDSDHDDDYYYSPSSPLTDDDDDEMQSDDECDRGRTRNIKPLVQLCGRLRVCTT